MKTSKTVVANFGLAGKYLKLESGGKPSELDICVKLGAYFDGEKRHELEKLIQKKANKKLSTNYSRLKLTSWLCSQNQRIFL